MGALLQKENHCWERQAEVPMVQQRLNARLLVTGTISFRIREPKADCPLPPPHQPQMQVVWEHSFQLCLQKTSRKVRVMLPIHCLDRQQFCYQKLWQNAAEFSSAPRGAVGHRTQLGWVLWFYLDKQKVREQGDGNTAARCALVVFRFWPNHSQGRHVSCGAGNSLRRPPARGLGTRTTRELVRNL